MPHDEWPVALVFIVAAVYRGGYYVFESEPVTEQLRWVAAYIVVGITLVILADMWRALRMWRRDDYYP